LANTAESQKSARATKMRKPRKMLSHSELRAADNKGFIVTHHYETPPSKDGAMPSYGMPEKEEHVFANGADMINHLKDKFKVKDEASTSKGQPARPASKGAATPKEDADEEEADDSEEDDDEEA
jgi:hypothetical protein